MIGRFEWHITVDIKYREAAKQLAEASNWTFSEITGCPILGQGTYCYITGYSTNSEYALKHMNQIVAILKALSESENIVLRAKIEDIVYDTKTSVNRLI